MFTEINENFNKNVGLCKMEAENFFNSFSEMPEEIRVYGIR